MVIVVGEILIDIFDTCERVGGAPFNFAFHLKQLGLPVRFFSRIGDDKNGQKISSFVTSHGFDAKDLQVDGKHPTGTVTVALDGNGMPTFTIHQNVAYDFLDFDPMASILEKNQISLVYFGSLVQRTPQALDHMGAFLARNSQRARCFCDINLRPDCYSRESVLQSLTRSDILKLSEEELYEIARLLGLTGKYTEIAMHLLKTYEIEMLLLTKGEKGSEAFTAATHEAVDAQKVIKIVDTVGAGDAFAAMVALGITKNWPLAKMLEKASDMARRICMIEGAIPDQNDFYSISK